MSDTDTTEDDGIDYDQLAESMINKLQSMGLSRRDMMVGLSGVAAGGLGLSSLTGNASAQTNTIDGIVYFDQLGTSDRPVKELYVETQTNFNEEESFSDLTVTSSLNDGGVVVDGDVIERNIWVIAAGASDPAGASSEDIILEEE